MVPLSKTPLSESNRHQRVLLQKVGPITHITYIFPSEHPSFLLKQSNSQLISLGVMAEQE